MKDSIILTLSLHILALYLLDYFHTLTFPIAASLAIISAGILIHANKDPGDKK